MTLEEATAQIDKWWEDYKAGNARYEENPTYIVGNITIRHCGHRGGVVSGSSYAIADSEGNFIFNSSSADSIRAYINRTKAYWEKIYV